MKRFLILKRKELRFATHRSEPNRARKQVGPPHNDANNTHSLALFRGGPICLSARFKAKRNSHLKAQIQAASHALGVADFLLGEQALIKQVQAQAFADVEVEAELGFGERHDRSVFGL